MISVRITSTHVLDRNGYRMVIQKLSDHILYPCRKYRKYTIFNHIQFGRYVRYCCKKIHILCELAEALLNAMERA